MIYWHIKVKFRAFFFTFGQLDKQGAYPLIANSPIPIPDADKVIVNERGVYLRLATKPFTP